MCSLMKPVPFEPFVRNRAFQLYLQGNHTYSSIGAICKKDLKTIKYWATKYKWATKKREMEHELDAQFERECKEIVQQNKPRVLRRHLHMAEMLDEKIEAKVQTMDSKNTTRELDEIARATKSSSEVSGKAIGLDKQSQSTVNVNVGVISNAKPISSDSYINVEATDSEGSPF